jgi:O-methyltransferase
MLRGEREAIVVKQIVRSAVRRLGFDVVRATPAIDSVLSDLDEVSRGIIRQVRPYTLTSLERLAAVVESVRHVVKHRIPGDFVECGVWRGGSSMAAALTLKELGDTSRTLYLYDTFEGMSEPTDKDRLADGTSAATILAADKPGTGYWCYASLEDVQTNVRTTGYPDDKIVYVKGRVEDTIPARSPERIALLRLDTDWYESTRHELEHLYPRLAHHGVLLIDDYGHWQGARTAVDEYVAKLSAPLFLQRVDYTGRVAIKLGE